MATWNETIGGIMKGLPLSGPMVRAWLEKRKSVTRRLMNPQPLEGSEYGGINVYGQAIFYPPDNLEDTTDSCLRKPRYLPGETVYIQETCYICGSDTDGAPLMEPPVVYRADGAQKSEEYPHVRTPRFMPEWASRSKALIVSARPERIREITEEEAQMEGVSLASLDGVSIATKDYRTAFKWLWDTLHTGSWDRNDWVFRYELKEVK